MDCPETSVRNCHYWLRNDPEERTRFSSSSSFHFLPLFCFLVLLKVLSCILAVPSSITGFDIDCDCRLVLVVMNHLKLDHDSLLPHPYQFIIHHLFCLWAYLSSSLTDSIVNCYKRDGATWKLRKLHNEELHDLYS